MSKYFEMVIYGLYDSHALLILNIRPYRKLIMDPYIYKTLFNRLVFSLSYNALFQKRQSLFIFACISLLTVFIDHGGSGIFS